MQRDQLIALVRKETGIKLSAADPVLAAAVINEVLLENALAKLGVSLKDAADRQAAVTTQQNEASKQQIEDAKKAAAVLVNSSAAWVTEQLKEAGNAVTASMLTELREETAKAESASKVAIKMAWVAGGAAVLTAAGLTGFFVAAS